MTASGKPLDAANLRHAFRGVVAAAGLDAMAWTPRELRHSFVSLLSSSGMPIEDISQLVGHASTRVTEKVYRQGTSAGSHPRRKADRCDLRRQRRSLGPSKQPVLGEQVAFGGRR